MSSQFDIQPIGRFVGQSAAIKRPKVSTGPPFYKKAGAWLVSKSPFPIDRCNTLMNRSLLVSSKMSQESVIRTIVNTAAGNSMLLIRRQTPVSTG